MLLYSVCFVSTWLIIVVNWASCTTTKAILSAEIKEVFDTSFPTVIAEEDNVISSSLFGYSVSLAKGFESAANHPQGWIFVGAPKSNTSGFQYDESSNGYEPGVIWRCRLGPSKPFKGKVCEMMNVDPFTPSRNQTKYGHPKEESHDGAMIGVSSEINHGRFVTCGMRWNRGRNQFWNGICYWFTENSINKTSYRETMLNNLFDETLYDQRLIPFFTEGKDEDRVMNFKDHFGKNDTIHEWQHSEAGISVHLFLDESLGSTSPNLLIGAPGVREWSGAVVLYTNRDTPTEGTVTRRNRIPSDRSFSEFLVLNRGIVPENQELGKNYYWDEYFGWSVSSGKYLNKTQVLYAAGAPRADHCGAVVIFTSPPYKPPKSTYKRQIQTVVNITTPENSFASYFGSVIHSVDLDDNGLDELIVGAPLYSFHDSHSAGDEGCVFVYKFKSSENDSSVNSAHVQRLCGSNSPGAKFGSAISSMTIDLKHKESNEIMKEVYLVVGAPYEVSKDGGETSGAIYVYFYNKTLGKIGKYTQRITAAQISKSLLGFGSSISIPADIDVNETPDMAIGAFKSGHAVVLRTRPRIVLDSWIQFVSSDDIANSKDIDIIRRGESNIFMKSCIKFKATFGKLAKRIIIWTKLKFNDQTIKFVEKHVKENAENTVREITFATEIYTQACKFITIESLSKNGIGRDDDSDLISGSSESPTQYKFYQEVWYNETLNRPTSVFKIHANRDLAEENSDFSLFKSTLPSSQMLSKQTKIAFVSLSDCEDICRPNLKMKWAFFNANSENESISSYYLGSTQEVSMRLTINNTGDTAELPKIQFYWNITEIRESTSGKRWLHRNCKDTSDSTHRIYDDCDLKPYIRHGQSLNISITFNLENVFVKEMTDFPFVVTANIIKIKNADPDKFEDSGELQLKVKTTQAIITGSRSKDVLRPSISSYMMKSNENSEKDESVTSEHRSSKDLYAPFRQGFTIEVQGASVSEAIAIFKIPISISEDNTKQAFLVRKPDTKSTNVNCHTTSSKFNFHMIEEINSKLVSKPPTSAKMRLDGTREENFYSSELLSTLYRRRREVATEKTDSSENQTEIIQKVPQITQDTLLPTRPAKRSIPKSENALEFLCVSEMNCLDVHCTIKNIKAFRPIHISFELLPIKERIDSLMKASGKRKLYIQSTGIVEIFPLSRDVRHYQDSDVAVTVLEKISGEVQLWVYFASAGGGILFLVCIIAGLFKCGFFKRQKREELNHMKAEHHRKSMIASAARSSMMVRQSTTAADIFESRENLTAAEHRNEDLDVKSHGSDETPSKCKKFDENASPATEVKKG